MATPWTIGLIIWNFFIGVKEPFIHPQQMAGGLGITTNAFDVIAVNLHTAARECVSIAIT
jgi:hypothetical protein